MAKLRRLTILAMRNRIDRIEGVTSAQRSLFFALRGKWRRFTGPFYHDDDRLAYEQCVSKKTIGRALKRLKEIGLIEYERGRFKGKATYYTNVKDDKLSTFISHSKTDKKSTKDDKMSRKDGQNVGPTVIKTVNNTVVGSSSACQGQASPTSLESLKGYTIEGQAGLDILLNTYKGKNREEFVGMIESGDIRLADGVRLIIP